MAKKIVEETPAEAIEENGVLDWNKLDTNSSDDPEYESEESDEDQYTDTEITDDTADEPEDAAETDEDDYLEVDFLKEKKRLSKSEAKQLAQKGLNYDHIKEKADKAAEYERELAELRVKIAQSEIDKQKEDLRKSLESEGYDADAVEQIITKHPAFVQVQKMLEQSQAESKKAQISQKRSAEKEALKDQPYFKELEPEINKMATADGYENVAMETMYNLLLGDAIRKGKLQELVAKTKQSTIADLQDKAKRAKSIGNERNEAEEIDVASVLDREMLEMTKAFGNPVKNVAKYVAGQLKSKRKG